MQKSRAHQCAGSHDDSGDTSPFLSAELIKKGQEKVKRNFIVNILRDLLASNFLTRHDIGFGLLLCTDILGADLLEIWKSSQNEHSSKIKVVEFHPQRMDLEKGLSVAIKTNNVLAVQQILNSIVTMSDGEFNANYFDAEVGLSLVSLAVIYKQFQVAAQLIEMGADPLVKSQKPSEEGRTLIFFIIEMGTIDLLQTLLNHFNELDLNEFVGDMAPIHVAVNFGRQDMIDKLLEETVCLELLEQINGNTPLIQALVEGKQRIAFQLLAGGASAITPNRDGMNPLAYAVSFGYSQLVVELVNKFDAPVNEKVCGQFHLERAIRCSRIEVLGELHSLGADMHVKLDIERFPPLCFAILLENIAASLELIRIGGGLLTMPVSQELRTPMFLAVENNQPEIVEALVAAGVDVNAATSSNVDHPRAIHVAATYGCSRLIPVLLKIGANVNALEALYGQTALQIAIKKTDIHSVRALLKGGACACIPDCHGKPAWFTAAEISNIQPEEKASMIRLIFSEGNVPINVQAPATQLEWTALHVAASVNDAEIAWLLLRLGANPSIKNLKNETALDLATIQHSLEVQNVLRRHVSR